MARPKQFLTGLVAWREKSRAIHAHLVEKFGLRFPESHLIQIVDSFLDVGSEGQQKGLQQRGGKQQGYKVHDPKAKTKAKVVKKQLGLTSVVRSLLDATPRKSKDLCVRAQKTLPEANADAVTKVLSALYASKSCKRQGEERDYLYSSLIAGKP